MKRSGLPILALTLTCIIWGTTWVVSKIGINQGIHPLYFSGIRQFCAGTIYLVGFAAMGKAVWPTVRQWAIILLLAVLLFVSSNGLTTWGLKYITSGLGAIMGAIFPMLVAAIEWIMGSSKKPNKISIIGLFLGFAGVSIIFYEHLADFAKADFTFGIILSLIAALTWAIGTIVTSKNILSLNRYYALGLQMFVAGSILLTVSIAGQVAQPLQQISKIGWASICYMIGFGSMLAFGAFVYMLQHLPTSLASIYAYINPMVAVILGHFLLGEPWNLTLAIGALVTLVGIYLVNWGYKKGRTAAE